MGKILSNYSTIDTERIQLEKMKLDKQKKEIELLKETLEKHFKFEIPNYIILDIIENEYYHHFCLMVNLAVVNERLSEQNGETLKQEIKKLFEINSDYDRLNKKVYLGSFDYEE